jgi:hypothetical protein
MSISRKTAERSISLPKVLIQEISGLINGLIEGRSCMENDGAYFAGALSIAMCVDMDNCCCKTINQ